MRSTKNYNGPIEVSSICGIIAAAVFVLLLIGCSTNDSGQGSQPPTLKGTVKGSVTDENGNPYPGTTITILKGSDKLERVTDAQGNFEGTTKGIGSYEVTLVPPLATKAVVANPATANVQNNQATSVDFVVDPQPVVAHLNFGDVQLLEEIKDENGDTPTNPNEPLYAANIFDAPLGLLTPIITPDGHHITLAEYKMAKGNLMVHCNGNSAIVEIALEGMIPNGTYTFWLAYLNKTRKVGEAIDFMNDFINPTNPPIGSRSGTENIVIAGADGTINTTLEHASCILTDEVALVIPILYHINGKTFGGGHVPDPEEVVQMLAYFQ
ncbi:MAG: hypothetical protein WBG90_10855 [Saonia sp.]